MKKSKLVSVFVLVLLACLFAGVSSSRDNKRNGWFWPKWESVVAGGTEGNISGWTPGTGGIEPGGKLRGWTAEFEMTLIGPAGDLASGSGPVSMSCNLDDSLTGPCWGTLEITNSEGTWLGTWNATFNFETGAGTYKAKCFGQGGLKGMILDIVSVYPGYAVSENGLGYDYATVYIPSIPGHHNSDDFGDGLE